MIIIKYNHELHGPQEIKCKDLINKEGLLLVRNSHGVTFQILEPSRILRITTIQGV